MIEPCQKLAALGFRLLATAGTAEYLAARGITVERINKVHEGRPHIVDAMKDGEVQLIFNTVEGSQAMADSFSLRQAALLGNIAYYTTVPGAPAPPSPRSPILPAASLKSPPSRLTFKPFQTAGRAAERGPGVDFCAITGT